MSVQSVYNPNVATIDHDEDARRAAQMMRETHVGDLIVTESRDGRLTPVGTVTDRDIVIELVAREMNPADIRVGDMIYRDLVSVREDAGIAFALQEMRKGGVRRVPVVNAHGELVGVLVLDDVIEYLARQLDEVAGTIRHQQVVEERIRP
jgi:predicted transcriptional regulator